VQVLVPGSGKQIRTDLNSWRQTLTAALGRDNLRLAEFPVRGSQGGALHFEAPVRLYFDGDWQPAAVFMPWVARLGMLPRLDARVVRAALETVRESNSELGIHMSAESLNDQQFRVQVLEALKRNPEAAARIWMEISEAAAFRQIEVFRDFGQQLKALGCKLGLEHVGSHFSRINELQELGLDFIKIDAALIRGASANLTSQAFLRGLCTIAHAIGLQVIAEGVRHENEPDCLFDLGFDGVTGPGVK